MALPIPKDIVTEGLGRILSVWEDKPIIRGLIESYLREVQITNDTYFLLLNNRDVFTAIGVQLDNIGAIVGQPRAGALDDEYRQNIFNRIAINKSDGTPDQVLNILSLITQANFVTLFEHFPASIHYFTDGFVTNKTRATMDAASGAGISTRLMFDGNNQSGVLAALVQSQDILGINTGDTLGIDTGDELGLGSYEVLPYLSTRSYLPHDTSDNIETINPLCAVV